MTLVISGTYYYVCGGNDVSHDFFTPIRVPLRNCDATAVISTVSVIIMDRAHRLGRWRR